MGQDGGWVWCSIGALWSKVEFIKLGSAIPSSVFVQTVGAQFAI
jgi:hypothetical protein